MGRYPRVATDMKAAVSVILNRPESKPAAAEWNRDIVRLYERDRIARFGSWFGHFVRIASIGVAFDKQAPSTVSPASSAARIAALFGVRTICVLTRASGRRSAAASLMMTLGRPAASESVACTQDQ